MAPLLFEYAAGTLFGGALFAAGVFSPSTIIAQMRLEDFTMVKVMLGASAVSALAIQLAHHLNHAPMKPRTPQSVGLFPYSANFIGGAMIGIGMATTGACPGTVFVQTGAGTSSGPLVLLGCVIGGLAFVTAQPYITRFRDSITNRSEQGEKIGSLTIPQSLGVSPWIVLAGWMTVCSGLISLIQRNESPISSIFSTTLVGPITGGILIGLAQACSLILTRHTIGTSGAFEDIGHHLQNLFRRAQSPSTKSFLTSSMIFDIGIICSSLLLSQFYRTSAPMVETNLVTPTTAILGGVVMAFGSRLAGGCTSGHGISGMATFSWASVVSVVSMFGAGVLTASVFG